jgi:hypothetical protein
MDAQTEKDVPFGIRQKITVFVIGLASALSAMTIYSTIFTANHSDLICLPRLTTLNESTNELVSQVRLPESCKIWSNASQSDLYDCSIDDKFYSSLVNEWLFVCDKSYLVGLTQTVYLVNKYTFF